MNRVGKDDFNDEVGVRVVLEVVPSGASDKVTVFDYANDDGKRQFLATHVKCVAWLATDDKSARLAGA
jgi:hypothetical protein